MKSKNILAMILMLIIAFTTSSSQTVSVRADADSAVSKDWASAYLKTVKKLNKQDPNSQMQASSDIWNKPYSYDLIYFNKDRIPELVVGSDGYWVSMYTYDPKQDKVCQVIDEWGYGAMGNAGYEYLPEKNFLRNYNSDFAGAVRYTYCGKMKKHKIVSRYPKELKAVFFDDKNKNGIPDEGEPADQERYYFGNKEITAKKFASYTKTSDEFQIIIGTMTYTQIQKKLRNFTK